MRPFYAVAIPAFAFALMTPAWAGGTQAHSYPPTIQSEQSEQSQQPQQSLDSGIAQQSAADASVAKESDQPRSQPQKHPPTAVMDRAASDEKASPGAMKPAEHPPTNRMDLATPELKSPDSAQQPSTPQLNEPATSSQRESQEASSTEPKS
jgi:hypothetical protein